NRLARNRRVHHHDVGTSHDARDRRDVTDEIEIELIVERRVDRAESTAQEERVSVGRRTYNRLGADIAAATPLKHGVDITDIDQNRHTPETGHSVAQKLRPLASNIALLQRQAGNIASRSCQRRDKAAANRVSCHREYDRYR